MWLKLSLIVLFLILIYLVNLRHSFVESFWNSTLESGSIELVNQIDSLNIDKVNVYQRKNGFVIKNGRPNKSFLNQYGWSCFLLMYSDSVLCEGCYFRKNNRDINHHQFVLSEKDSSIDCTLNIDGAFEESMLYYKFFQNDSVYYLNKDKVVYQKGVEPIPNLK